MNDILATLMVCVLSETLIRELPTHYEPEFDYEGHLQTFKVEDTSENA